ncbi:MAG TPA: 3-phosphoshikimate 1-carboxyvinyltransferase [Casimicrobiaceae bacterium]|nr:3-phosphoshikimate 1-carboxyvinyltransferase [Casimicrobiaceae bacterium]
MTERIVDELTLGPARRVEGVVDLPGSKSISNRVLLLAALSSGSTVLRSLLDADDVARMREALAVLGVKLEPVVSGRSLSVAGTDMRFPRREAELFLGNAGTAVRPLTAALAVLGGRYTIRGVARMHERPIGDLVEPLVALGCDVRYLGAQGFPPLAIGESRAHAGTAVRIRADVSSQFLSALLMALPLARDALTKATRVTLATPLVSRPYVAITTNLMRRFGVDVEQPDAETFVVPAGARYVSPGAIDVEGDVSAASYFLAAGVLGQGPVRVRGAGHDSIQGDVAFADVLRRSGADVQCGDNWIEARSTGRLNGGTHDCNDIPDAAMTLAVVALFADAPTTLQGIASWRAKETDRIAAMATELRKLGARVDAQSDRLVIVPPERVRSHVAIDTYDDHRMAMCFSLVAAAGVPVTIRDPQCVAKTFPDYFAVLDRLMQNDG